MTDWTFIAGISEETTDAPAGYSDSWTHDAPALAAGRLLMLTLRIDAWAAPDTPFIAIAGYHLGADNPDNGVILVCDGSTLYASGLIDGFASLPTAVPGWAALMVDANGTGLTVATFAGDPSLPGATPTASAAAVMSTPLVGTSNYRRFWPGDESHTNMTAAVSDGFGFYAADATPPPPPPPPAPQPHIKAGPHRTGFLRH